MTALHTLMRDAAIYRHRWVWLLFEGQDPAKWPAHMSVIRAVYGW